MQRTIHTLASCLLVTLVLVGSVPAATFTVTKTADTADGVCNADCSLREAIIAANGTLGLDMITVPAGTYVLDLVGDLEDGGATGDLDVTDDLTLTGAGAATVIDGNGTDRVLDIQSGTVEIIGVTVQNGLEDNGNDGGGIRNPATLTVRESVIRDNTAVTGAGGGISTSGGSLIVIDSTIRDNVAEADGGGIDGFNAEITVSGSTISGNDGGAGSGSGIEHAGTGTLEITNCTISANFGHATAAVWAAGDSTVITNTTITANTLASLVASTGAGLSVDNAPVTLTNTIIADNVAGNTLRNCSGDAPTSGGHNIDDDGSCSLTGPGDQSNVADALLGPLQSNGGLTETHALLPGSPAIDAGNDAACPPLDQRGVARADGDGDMTITCDVGAFEAVPVPMAFTVTKTADTADGVCNADCSLREAIIAANGTLGLDMITVPAGTYVLDLVGDLEDAAGTGDLDIRDDLLLTGAGAAVTIVDGNATDRVFHVVGSHVVEITAVTVRNGDALSEFGGGIFNAGVLTLRDSVISDNRVLDEEGGGIANHGSLTVMASTITRNFSDADGGGICSEGSLTIIDSTISDNIGEAGTGAGIAQLDADTLIMGSTISGNMDSEGLHQSRGNLVITNSTISGNDGGVLIELDTGGTATITNSTITDNHDPHPGLGIFDVGGIQAGRRGSVTITNTVVAANTPENCDGDPLSSNGHNIDDDGSCSLTGPGDQSNVADALLGPLQSNGGLTETHALLPGSPAIDAGNDAACPALDQRGQARADGDGDGVATCDVGAFEAGERAAGSNTVTTDTEGDGATAADAVETTVTSPNPGTITIVEDAIAAHAPSGFALLGQEVSITAPAATVANPLEIVFHLDASIVPAGQDESTIQIFKDGTLVGTCQSVGSGRASPDPCVASRALLGDGDIEITVRTSTASGWNFGVRAPAPVGDIVVDVRVGDEGDSVRPGRPGRIPVAILTTDAFDASTVDVTTVRFGPTGTEATPVKSTLADVDDDGDDDLLLHFQRVETGIVCGDTSVSLTGTTLSGQPITGGDNVRTVGCGGR